MTGYKQPPKNTQFRKGQSGNPKGRPKVGPAGMTGSAKATLAAGARMMTIRENGIDKRIQVIEGIEFAQHKSALGGNSLAQKHSLDRYHAAERERRAEIADEVERWIEHVENLRIIYDHAERSGQPEPDIYPHPDDVVIDYEKGVTFIGPLDGADRARLEVTLRLRDLLILQYALDQRLCDGHANPDVLDRPVSALAIALYFNEHVPVRYRYDDARLADMMTRAQTRNKRDLLKAVYNGWRALGASPRRGKTLPTPRVMLEDIRTMMEAFKMLQAEASGTNKQAADD